METKLTEMQKLDAEARESATNQVIKMLQRPGTLEKVEQFKHRLSRKKASVEALLKSAMQSQLDGVRLGLNQLQGCLIDLKKVETSVKSLNAQFGEVPTVYNQLSSVRDEHMRHSQYVTAIENLKYIFTVPESVRKTRQWISEGKLLHTHQCLKDLENSRDDLLYELHKFPNQNPHDTSMLKAYFAQVQELSKDLEKQLKLVLSRTLNTVRKEPTEIVTALRIIEREEKADQFALAEQRQTGFLPPGRPKLWRKLAFDEFEKAVSQRIEGTHVDDRENNKMWLVRYLELTRQLILEDLRVVKTLAVPCFPSYYNIFERYVEMYHNALSRHLQELIQNGLEGNEYVSLLSWVLNTYWGPELMGHPELSIRRGNLTPLLPHTTLSNLQSTYLKNLETNYQEWMSNTLTSEKSEWLTSTLPENHQNGGILLTSAPVIIFQMIDQNLQVTSTISTELTFKVLLLSVDQVIDFGSGYQKAIVEFKDRHFEDRSKMPIFTQSMISIVNNCLQFKELGLKLKDSYSGKVLKGGYGGQEGQKGGGHFVGQSGVGEDQKGRNGGPRGQNEGGQGGGFGGPKGQNEDFRGFSETGQNEGFGTSGGPGGQNGGPRGQNEGSGGTRGQNEGSGGTRGQNEGPGIPGGHRGQNEGYGGRGGQNEFFGGPSVPNMADLLDSKFDVLSSKFVDLRNETVSYLLQEAFLDLEKPFEEIFTQKWVLQTSNSVDTICVTLEDYFHDYKDLSEVNYRYVLMEAQKMVSKKYLLAMLSKKYAFKSFLESNTANKKIFDEISKLQRSFSNMGMNLTSSGLNSGIPQLTFDLILTLSEVLKCEDADMLSLDLHGIVDKFPDISEDHLKRLLYLRGDLPQNEIKEKINFALQIKKSQITQTSINSRSSECILREIVFSDRIINW